MTLKKMKNLIPFTLLLFALLVSCTTGEKKYKIGVSQCSEDIWRDKQNAEMRMGGYFHDDVELRFSTAYDSDERQVQQIDSLVQSGIDLLIVAPNQVATISPAIDRAYDKGIPVIVFERKTNSHKYTAFIGADNYEMGRAMGEYVTSRLKGKGRVIEIMGLKGSSPAIERHKGFSDALSQYPDIQLVATLQGDWTEQSAYDAVKAYEGDLSHIDFVFGQNDRMAMGARRALAALYPSPSAKYCGIDGLAGENGGIRLVRDSILDATYIYPTHGDRLLSLALDILDGKPYDKEIRLMSALVTDENANVLLMQNEEIVRQSGYLDDLHNKVSEYRHQLSAQRTINWLVFGLWLLLLLLAGGVWLFLRQRARIQRERTQMEREQLDFYTQVSHELRTPLTLIEGPLAQLAGTPELAQASTSTASLFDIVRRNTRQLTELINKMLDVQVKGEVSGEGSTMMGEKVTDTVAEVVSPSLSSSAFNESPDTSVLIVDDNADIRAYLRTILQDRYQILEAEDGQKGLELAQQQVPDLIVSDVMMPVMNGLEFCQHVKDGFITSHIPVILLTARALSRHQVEGYRSGADAYITKPFETDLLLARIDNLLRSRRLLKNLWDKPATTDKKNVAEPEEEAAVVGAETPQSVEATAAPLAISEAESPFITRFKAVVEDHLADSELSVETIGSELGLSRVQLYRKVKALTGTTPVDLLRKARLSKSRQLLTQTDLSVSEIAYKVGFTSPSYFTKCFKDEYGMVPGDARQ